MPGPSMQLAAAMAFGAGRAKSEAQSQKKADEQTDAASKTKMTINGDGTLDIKGATPEMLQGREQAALQEAKDSPLREARKVAEMFGYQVGGVDPESVKSDLSSFSGSYRAARQGGSNRAFAILAGALGKTGRPLKGLQEDTANLRASQLTKAYREAKPILVEERAEANADRSEQAAVAAEERRRRSEVAKVINDVDLDALTPENVASLAGVDELSPAEKSSLTARRKVLETKIAKDEEKTRKDAEREERAAAREQRALEAEARAAAREARAARSEDRTISREDRKQFEGKVDTFVKRIEDNNKQIQANTRAFAKSTDPEERATLQKQNLELRTANVKTRDELDGVLGAKAVSQAEWNELRKRGHTVQSLRQKGIYVR